MEKIGKLEVFLKKYSIRRREIVFNKDCKKQKHTFNNYKEIIRWEVLKQGVCLYRKIT